MSNNIVSINGYLDSKLLDTFIQQFNNTSLEHSVTVYISTPGGEVGVASAIRNILEESIQPVRLIAYCEIQSAGFDIFFATKCSSKTILKDTIGMVHKTICTFDFNASGKPINKGYHKVVTDNFLNEYINYIQFLSKLGLTETELKRYKRGEDVFFNFERLEQLLKNNG